MLFNGLDASNHNTLWETNGTSAGTREIDTADIDPEDMTLFTSGAELSVVSISQNPTSSGGADLKAGKIVSHHARHDRGRLCHRHAETRAQRRRLCDLRRRGGHAGPDLQIHSRCRAKQFSDLEIVSASLAGASITDASGFHADLSPVSGTNLGIKIDTTAPTVSGVTETPASGTTLKLGGTAKIDLHLTEPVIVSGTPTLKLSDGGVAPYNSGASDPATGVLEFDYTVTTNQSSADLQSSAPV